MGFNPDIPNANEKLSASQPVLRSNNQALDTTFGVDHYPFKDGTANNGFHTKVTTPTIAIPATADDPKLYGHRVTTDIGTIQFSRGANNMAPTPLTSVNGIIPNLAPLTTVKLLDFSGVTTSVFRVTVAVANSYAIFSGSVLGATLFGPKKTYPTTPSFITLPISGSILNIRSQIGATNMYWFVEFLRLE